ncbi:MAG: glucuronate isomerase [candidate division WOR-3 bacterium]|jgi:glucuronate isomerase
MGFLDDDYLLESTSAIELYARIKNLPIIDLHSHIDIEEILRNKPAKDIWEAEGATDHYVWELMRRRGVTEEKITGKATNREKWTALAEVFPELGGNPTYEWIHLDLRRRFGIQELISKQTSDAIWEKTSALLEDESMTPQNLLKYMRIELMCTTDDPTSDLRYHKKAREELEKPVILPTWRPDKVMNIENGIWKDFLEELGKKTGEDTGQLEGLLTALEKRHDYFSEHGCIASDHGMEKPYSFPVPVKIAADIHSRAFKGEKLKKKEIIAYKAFMLNELGKLNKAKNWLTQLHIGAVRDYRNELLKTLGVDSGGDISTQNVDFAGGLKYFLNEFAEDMDIVIYCLDPTHLPTITTIARAYPKVIIGAPWWFNDSPFGMETHLKYVASVDLISNCGNMVSDSRKLLSYGSRTEVFRRVLSNVVGEMMEKGQIPRIVAQELVENLSYHRVKNLVDSRSK